MFLHYLNDPQKRALFYLGHQMIHADHVVAPAEVCYRDLLIHEAGLGPIPSVAPNDGEPLLDLFTDRQSCTALVIELLVLAIIDGAYHPEEAVFAQTVVSYFGFTDDDQDKINRMAEHIAGTVTGFWDLIQTPSV
ncbi:MAG: hypothetical protein HQ483_20120 [Rhodospirillales bacterium]|nr:hypothetical protein [Rhodospirillales bacterium]